MSARVPVGLCKWLLCVCARACASVCVEGCALWVSVRLDRVVCVCIWVRVCVSEGGRGRDRERW